MLRLGVLVTRDMLAGNVMHRFILTLAVVAQLSVGGAQQITSSLGEPLDVPPCHPAAESVRRLFEKGILIGFPSTSSDLARNAVLQVFEGLRCRDIAWTTRFLSGVPQGYATGIPFIGAPLASGFELQTLETRVSGETATVRFRVTYREGNVTTTRSGTARLIRDAQTGWRVEFGSLAEANLTFFPSSR